MSPGVHFRASYSPLFFLRARRTSDCCDQPGSPFAIVLISIRRKTVPPVDWAVREIREFLARQAVRAPDNLAWLQQYSRGMPTD